MQTSFQDIKFSDADVVDLDNWIAAGEYNPHSVRPWLFHDHGFVLCVVFADSLQDALDEAVDADKLDRYLIAEGDMKDYENEEGISFLGNAGEPFDIESLGVIELPNPKRSFCAQFDARDVSLDLKASELTLAALQAAIYDRAIAEQAGLAREAKFRYRLNRSDADLASLDEAESKLSWLIDAKKNGWDVKEYQPEG